jgi:imidazolonepropionase-like amidohydrolase
MCQGCIGNVFGSLGGLRLDLSRRQFFATAAAATAIAPMAPALAASGDGADLIFHGGPVIPLAGFGQYAEALAVKNGKIIAVGTSDAVMGLKANSTQVIDLDGRAVLPGFIDPH